MGLILDKVKVETSVVVGYECDGCCKKDANNFWHTFIKKYRQYNIDNELVDMKDTLYACSAECFIKIIKYYAKDDRIVEMAGMNFEVLKDVLAYLETAKNIDHKHE
jgi:hypothetical protein